MSPLATLVAKFFQNSIREDILISLAANGIIYTAGAAGTVQEVFQTAAQNYYPRNALLFAPMIFLGREFWTEKMPVISVLEALFIGGRKVTRETFAQLVRVVDTPDEAVNALLQHHPSTTKMMNHMQAVAFGPLMSAAQRLPSREARS